MTQLRPPPTADDPVRRDSPAMHETSRLEIDLGRLDRNVAAIRQWLARGGREKTPKLCGVVKKNAYGLGAVPIAHRLCKAGCDMLAVYGPDEAEQLVKGAVTFPILLFMPLSKLSRTDLLYRHAVAEKLHLSIHEPGQIEQVNQIGRTFGIRMPVHLYVDTGMSRGGLSAEQFGETLVAMNDTTHVRIAGVYSHLATADANPAFAQRQLDQFERTLDEHAERLPADALRHLANSYATMRDPRFHLNMVRCGLGLWGYGTEDLREQQIDELPTLEPIVRWVSRIIHVQRYKRRSPVGYGSTHRLKRDSVLGLVPVGYGDGYPLALSNKATVRVLRNNTSFGSEPQGRRPPADCAVLGKVNMDQIMIDLTDVDATDPQELHGCAVELISADPAAPSALPALAKLAKAHCYELLCRLSPRIPRKYL